MTRPHFLFVTGKLAEPSLRRTLEDLAPRADFDFGVRVLPITVVALATTPWIARHLEPTSGIDRVLIPGLCQGDLEPVRAVVGTMVERGPEDLCDLPEHFQTTRVPSPDYGRHDISVLAEINYAPRLTVAEILDQARELRAAGADIIDVGCSPGDTWSGVGTAVKALRDDGQRVSIDSFNSVEVEAAVKAGAELVLSVNGGSVDRARHWGCEVVVLPDDLATLEGLDASIEKLSSWQVPFRIDPVLEPIGLGFAASLGRYLEVRRRYPRAEMLMGVGNLTELTDVDSAGVNVLLLGFCQELGIRSVLTTQVINWARTCVRELDLARRLVWYAVQHRVLPKNLQPDLLLLRDPRLRVHGDATLAELSRQITDRNFRLFAEGGQIHVLNRDIYLKGNDPFDLFEQMSAREPIDPSHAFYLGFEMSKALTALALRKNYTQDQALRWGFLTVPEPSHGPIMKEETRG